MIIETVLNTLEAIIEFLVGNFGYWGILVAMAIESACIPLPSEVIMPLSGLMVAEGKLNFWLVGLVGAVGNVVGSVIAYYAGVWGGRPLLAKYGKYVLISLKDLDRAEKWFAKYGDAAIFFSRMMPVIRTFISFPAGVARMNMPKFLIYTFAGALPWSLGLTYIGVALGENWPSIKTYFHGFDVIIGIALIAFIVWYVRRHLREAREARLEEEERNTKRASAPASDETDGGRREAESD